MGRGAGPWACLEGARSQEAGSLSARDAPARVITRRNRVRREGRRRGRGTQAYAKGGASAAGLRVPLTPEVEAILQGSGVLDGPRRAQLLADVVALVLRHADLAFSDSRVRIQALMEDIGPSDLTHPDGFERPKG